MYFPSRKNKGADHYREADLHLCFRIMQIVGFLRMSQELSELVTVFMEIKQIKLKSVFEVDNGIPFTRI